MPLTEMGGYGRLASVPAQATLDYLARLRAATTPAARERLRTQAAAARLARVRAVVRERPEVLTLDFVTGPAASVVPTTVTTDQRLPRPVDIFAAGLEQYLVGGATQALNLQADLRHSRTQRSYFVPGETRLVRGQLFDLFDTASSTYAPLRELPTPIPIEPGEYLSLDYYHEFTTPSPLRTRLHLVGRSQWPAGAAEGQLSARDEARCREVIAQNDLPQFREMVAPFEPWTNGGTAQATTTMRSPALREPAIVRAVYAPTAVWATINRLRVGQTGTPIMTAPVPLRLLAQSGTGSRAASTAHGLELPVPLFLPEGERLYADIAAQSPGIDPLNFDPTSDAYSVIKFLVETP